MRNAVIREALTPRAIVEGLAAVRAFGGPSPAIAVRLEEPRVKTPPDEDPTKQHHCIGTNA